MDLEFQPKEREIALVERLIVEGCLERRQHTDREVSNGEWFALQLRFSENGVGDDHLRK